MISQNGRNKRYDQIMLIVNFILNGHFDLSVSWWKGLGMTNLGIKLFITPTETNLRVQWKMVDLKSKLEGL